MSKIKVMKGFTMGVFAFLIAFSLLLIQSSIFGAREDSAVFAATAPTPPITPIVSTSWIANEVITSGTESAIADVVLSTAGTEADPYLLSSVRDLAWLAYRVNAKVSGDNYFSGKYFKIGLASESVINLSGHSWTPIGNTAPNYFGGHFDGNNVVINGLTIVNGTASEGFFGNIQGGTVKNLKFTSAYVSSSAGNNDGIVVGNVLPVSGRTDIIFSDIEVDENSFIISTDTADTPRVGGLFGSFGGNKIIDCVNHATVVGSAGLVAGISANIQTPAGIAGTEFTNCLNTGAVYNAATSGSNFWAGGLFGQVAELSAITATITFTNCRNEGDVTGKTGTTGAAASNSANAAGGVVAYSLRSVIFENCSNTGDIESDYQPGGILGLSTSTRNQVMTNCYNTGDIIVWGTNAGGLIGETYTVDMTDCYNTGNVTMKPGMTGNCRMGGLAGEMKGNIINCYNTGEIYSERPVAGGLIGSAYSRSTTSACAEVLYIENCYNTGNVTGKGINVAGLVAYVGYLRGLVIKDSHNHGNLTNNSIATTTDNQVGGLIGEVDSNATSAYVRYVQMDRCSNTGSITAGRTNVGGLFGRLAINKDASLDSWIRDSYNTGNMVNKAATGPNAAHMGGIVGILLFFAGSDAKSFEISNVYNTGTISAPSVATPPASWGGLLGTINAGLGTNKEITIENSYSVAQPGVSAVGATVDVGGTTITGGSDLDVLKTEQDLIDELTSSLDPEIWGSDPGTNGGLPYLKSNQEELVVTGLTSVDYAGSVINLTSLLAITGGSTAGALTYTLVGGDGIGTISGSNLTVTKAGTFLITVTRPGDALYKKIEMDVLVTVSKGAQTISTTDQEVNYTTTPMDLDTLFGLSGVSYAMTSGDVVGTINGTLLTLSATGVATITISKAGNDLYDSASITVTLTVNKANQTAIAMSNKTEVYAGASFDLATLFAVTGGTTSGAIGYTVTNGTGEGTLSGTILTVTKAGTFTIEATMAGNGLYNAVSTTATLTVNKANQAAIAMTGKTETYAGATFDIVTLFAVTGGTTSGAIGYTVTNGTGEGTLSGTILTVTKAGTFTIEATMAGNGLYNAVLTTATLTINKGTTTISASDQVVTYSGNIDLDTIFGTAGVTYAITSGDVVGTIAGVTLIPSKSGVATITITKAGNDLYNGASITATLTINKANQTAIAMTGKTETYAGASFDLATLFVVTGGTTSGAIGYTVSNGTGEGTLAGTTFTVTKAGTFTIEATMAGNGLYNAVSTTATLTVNKANQTLAASNQIVDYAKQNIDLDTIFGTAGVTYAITSGDIVGTIAGATLTPSRSGVATITISKGGNDLYNNASITVTLTLNKANQDTLIIIVSATVTVGTYNLSTTGGSGSGTVEYFIETGTTATANIVGDVLTVTANGMVKLKAVKASDDLFNSIFATRDYETTKIEQDALTITGTTTVQYAGVGIDLSDILEIVGGNTNGIISYVIKSTDGAGVLNDEILTVTKAGDFVITVVMAGDAFYHDVTKDVIITINKGTRDLDLDTATTYNKDGVDLNSLFGITATYVLVEGGTGDGTLNDEMLEVTRAGTIFIEFTMSETDLYNEYISQTQLTVLKANYGVTLTNEQVVYNGVALDLSVIFPITLDNSTENVVYSVANIGGAGALADTILTITKAGTFAVTITIGANDLYNAFSETITLTVDKGTATINTTNKITTYVGLGIDLLLEFGLSDAQFALQVGGDGVGTLVDNILTVTRAGSFIVNITLAATHLYEEVTGGFELQVYKGNYDLEILDQTITYNAQDVDLDDVFSLVNANYAIQNITGSATIIGTVITITKAGTIEVAVTKLSDNTDLWNDLTQVVILTINKGTQDALIINSTTSIVYGAGDYSLSFTGGTTGAVVTYAIQSNSTGNGSVLGSTITITRAGTIKIIATMPGNDLYNEVESTVFDLLVQKATPGAVSTPTTSDSHVFGQKLSNWNLSIPTWAWLDEDAIPTVGSDHTAFIVVDDVNYDYTSVAGYNAASHSIEALISVDVEKAQNIPQLVAPTLSETKDAGTVLGDWQLPQGWYWDDSSIVTASGEKLYSVYYYVDDVNYDYTGVEGYDAARGVVVYQVKVTTIPVSDDDFILIYVIVAGGVVVVILLGTLIIVKKDKNKNRSRRRASR